MSARLAAALAIFAVFPCAFHTLLAAEACARISAPDGKPLPGVQVSFVRSSKALTLVAVTNEDGIGCFVLEPGTYQAYAYDSRSYLGAGPYKLKVASTNTSFPLTLGPVILACPGPSVFTYDTTIGLHVSDVLLKRLPVGRNVFDVGLMAPGAR